MSEAKRHHYIPQFILKNFLDNKGQVFYWDIEKEVLEKRNPRSIFMNFDMYRDEVNHKDKPTSIESSLAIFEGEIATLIRQKFLKDNDIKFLKTPIGEDVYFNLQANTLANDVKIIDYIGYNWYFNGKSVTNTINNKIKKIDIIELLNTHYNVLKEKDGINKENYDLIQIYFVLLSIQFLQWLSKDLSYKEISEKYDMIFDWIEKHFKNYKRAKYWKLSKGDRLKIRLIFLVFMTCHRLHLGKLAVYMYKYI